MEGKQNVEPWLTGSKGLNTALKTTLEAEEGSLILTGSSIMQIHLRDHNKKGISEMLCSEEEIALYNNRKMVSLYHVELLFLLFLQECFYFLISKDWDRYVSERCCLFFWNVFFLLFQLCIRDWQLRTWKVENSLFHGPVISDAEPGTVWWRKLNQAFLGDEGDGGHKSQHPGAHSGIHTGPVPAVQHRRGCVYRTAGGEVESEQKARAGEKHKGLLPRTRDTQI